MKFDAAGPFDLLPVFALLMLMFSWIWDGSALVSKVRLTPLRHFLCLRSSRYLILVLMRSSSLSSRYSPCFNAFMRQPSRVLISFAGGLVFF